MNELWVNVWDQKEWLFGGIGVVILVGVAKGVWRIIRKPAAEGRTQTQRGGALSKNTQIMIDNKESGRDS